MSSPIRREATPGLTRRSTGSATIAFRRHLWFVVSASAEAMDTAQRGMGMDWPQSARVDPPQPRCGEGFFPGAMIGSASAPTISASASVTIDDVIRAYEEPSARRSRARRTYRADGGPRAGGRRRDRAATTPRSYGRILRQVKEPVIIHWLGEMFDPALGRVIGATRITCGDGVAIEAITANAAKVDGVKVSLLDKDKEIAMAPAPAAGRCACIPATTSTTRS